MIRTLCPDPKAEILVELLKFEGSLAAVPGTAGNNRVLPAKHWEVAGDEWLTERPEFRRESVSREMFRYRINQLVLAWDENPNPGLLDEVAEHPNVVLFFNDGQPQYFTIDITITDRLLKRFNGYFSVSEVLDNMNLRWRDLSPLWEVLSRLAESGLIVPGYLETYDLHACGYSR
jgi:hypothetical protein